METLKEEDLLLKKTVLGHIIYATGILSMSICAFAVAASSICVQGLERAVPDFELNTIRNGFALMVVCVICCVIKQPPTLPKEDIIKTGLYTVLLFADTLGLYISVTFIPLATQQAFYVTTTLLGGMLLLWILLKVRPTASNIFAILLCAFGLFMVLQPDFMFSHPSEIKFQNYSSDLVGHDSNDVSFVLLKNISNLPSIDSGFTLDLLGCGLAVFAGLCVGGIVVSIRRYERFYHSRTNLLITLFWAYLFSTISSFVLMLVFEKPLLPTKTKDYLLVFGHTICNIFIAPTHVYAASIIDGNTANIVSSTSIVYMVIAQYTFFKDWLPGNRNWIEILGVSLLIAGSILSSVVELLKSRNADSDEISDEDK